MPRFIHTADWQIGRQYPAFEPDDGLRLSDARLSTVARLAELASHHAVDAVLVAGDVFDSQTVGDKTIRRLFQAMQGFAGPWVLLPGNHDAALAESVWTRAQRLGAVPPHVRLALAAQPIVLAAQGMVILPAPLMQRHTQADTTAWFDAAQTAPGLCRIGLAHGSVQGVLAESMTNSNLIAADRAQTARLDYLALGDWHGLKQIDARTAYSGTPEPERFRDNDAGHALLVELDAPGQLPSHLPRLTPLATAAHPWLAQSLVLNVPSDVTALIEASARWPAHAVLRLRLSGEVDASSHSRLQRALGQARARLAALLVQDEALTLQTSEADWAELVVDGYLQDVLLDLRERQAQGEVDAAQALRILAQTLMRERGEA